MFVHLTHAAISLALSIAADVTQLGGVAAQSLSEPHYRSDEFVENARRCVPVLAGH